MLKAMPEKTSTRKVKICQQENTAIGWTRQSERSLLSPTCFFPRSDSTIWTTGTGFSGPDRRYFCCTYVSCAKKNLLYTISFSARVSLALLSLRKNRGLFVVYVSAGSSRVKQEKLRGKLSVNYVIVNLRGVASGEFWGACHHPPLWDIVLYLHNSGVENALIRKINGNKSGK